MLLLLLLCGVEGSNKKVSFFNFSTTLCAQSVLSLIINEVKLIKMNAGALPEGCLNKQSAGLFAE